jgi:hypothetical protein
MKSFLAVILVCGLLLAVPTCTFACPYCKDAIAASDGEEEPSAANLPAAYNNSIYLMVGMPYLLLGVFGFLVYRGLKKNAQYREAFGAIDASR